MVEWIEMLVAGAVGLIVSWYLISLILQASRLVGQNRENLLNRQLPADKFLGTTLAKGLLLLILILAILQETGFFLSSERWLVITGFLVLAGALAGLTIGNSLIHLLLHSSGQGSFARDPHHTHQVPVPRLGGIALAGAMATVCLVFTVFCGSNFLLQSDRWLVVASSLAMAGLGVWDDLFGLGARRKLAGQVLIASVTFFCGIGIYHCRIPLVNHFIDLGVWSWPVTVIWLVAMTNLINLIDGVDGLAGGICLMLMVLLLYVSHATGSVSFVTAGMIGALLGFLRFNFPPARIYMGDGGAYFLGFLIGTTTIVTSQKGTIFAALVAPLFVLALPIIDTSLAIMRRGVRGLPLFRPDRKHIHHRLLALGHSRRRVVLGLYGFTAVFLLLGFATFCFHGQYFPLFLGIGAMIILLVAGRLRFSREWFSIGRVLGNSLMSRQDVQYGMSLSRWLAMEGTRAETIESLAEDVVFIARKLGFSNVRIRLEDDEKVWQLEDVDLKKCDLFRHGLPGYKNCFLELGLYRPGLKMSPTPDAVMHTESTVDVLADLLAEGWVKAVLDWQKIHQLPVRFRYPSEELPAAIETAVVARHLRTL
jgi:UDP-GlcNAc:undecaprenyl-phosphate GlcNAc-1-phosphate transferase